MARWIVFTDNVFWKYSWAHVVISITVAFLYVMQCRLRARRSQASSMVFRPWPLRTEIVPDSLNLWMILCTVDDDNFKLFAIFLWETPFWYCSTIFATRHWGNWWYPLPILTSVRHCRSERLFLYPVMLPIDPISCKLVLQLFLICTFNFPASIATCPNFFGMCSSHEIQMSQYLPWHFKMSHFQHLIVIYILLWIKYKFMRFVNYCIPFLFTICTVSQLFWNRVCK